MSNAKAEYMDAAKNPDFCPFCLARDSTVWPISDPITGHVVPMCEICEKKRGNLSYLADMAFVEPLTNANNQDA